MFRSQTDEQLAAKHDPKPTFRQGSRMDSPLRYAPRIDTVPSKDPLPWITKQGNHTDRYRFSENVNNVLEFDPRPEFARPPVNRMLFDFRWMHVNQNHNTTVSRRAVAWLDSFTGFTKSYTPEELAHARKVLTRLSNLY